jgi:hypothetical protein
VYGLHRFKLHQYLVDGTIKSVWFRQVFGSVRVRQVSLYLFYAGGRPHRFPHNNFSSVYWIFTKLGHMIPLWKGKNPIYFGVIRSKVKVTITINRFFDNRVVST